MAITRPIPKYAMEIVQIIREEVPRPKKLPRIHWSRLCFVRPGEALLSSCPMGLIPGAAEELPMMPSELPDRINVDYIDMESFAEWWDEQADAAAAVEAVWPRKGKQ